MTDAKTAFAEFMKAFEDERSELQNEIFTGLQKVVDSKKTPPADPAGIGSSYEQHRPAPADPEPMQTAPDAPLGNPDSFIPGPRSGDIMQELMRRTFSDGWARLTDDDLNELFKGMR